MTYPSSAPSIAPTVTWARAISDIGGYVAGAPWARVHRFEDPPSPWQQRHRPAHVTVLNASCGRDVRFSDRIDVERPDEEAMRRFDPSLRVCSECIEWEVYPEHAKHRTIKARAQAVGDFVEWLRISGYVICREVDGVELVRANPAIIRGRVSSDEETFALYLPEHKAPQAWIAERFGIDAQAYDDEKRAMLEVIRKAQEPA